MEMRQCSRCKLFKEQNSTNFQWRNSGHWSGQCKKCLSEIRSANPEKSRHRNETYRNNNREKISRKNRERFKLEKIEEKEKRKKKHKEYRVKNPDKIREFKRRASIKQNKKPKNKMRKLVSCAIGSALKRSGSSKNGNSVMQFLPYTANELRAHIESLWEPWMTWENYGRNNDKKWNDNDPSTWTWQVDHIVPQADLPYDSMEHPNFSKCWALENLRPYSAKQNALDGGSRVRHQKSRQKKAA